MEAIKVIHPFEGIVTEHRVKLSASDLLANEEGVIRSPDDISVKEAMDICSNYGYYTFIKRGKDE